MKKNPGGRENFPLQQKCVCFWYQLFCHFPAISPSLQCYAAPLLFWLARVPRPVVPWAMTPPTRGPLGDVPGVGTPPGPFLRLKWSLVEPARTFRSFRWGLGLVYGPACNFVLWHPSAPPRCSQRLGWVFHKIGCHNICFFPSENAFMEHCWVQSIDSLDTCDLTPWGGVAWSAGTSM